MGKLKKSTIKFQKTKLKAEIERRRKFAKVKKHINRRKEKRNRAQGKNATENKETPEQKQHEQNKEKHESTLDNSVNTAEYFSNFEIGADELLDLSNDEESDLNPLDELEAVVEDDIEMEHYHENEEEDSDDESMDDEEEEDDDDNNDTEEDDMDGDEDEDEEDTSQLVTKEMLKEWTAEAARRSPKALKHLLLAFRAIVRSDLEANEEYTYRVASHRVYKKLMKETLRLTYPILSQHIVLTKKVRHPAKTKLWPKLEKVVRLFLNNCVRFLRDLEQDDLVEYTLTQLEPCTVYFGCFPKAAREYLRVLLGRWSDNGLSSTVRARCYQAIKHFTMTAVDTEKKNYLPHALKGTYLVFARSATKISEKNIELVQQMMEEASDLYAIDPKLSYIHANVYVRQLSNHLKTAKKAQTQETLKAVYNWQFVSCIDFWCSVVSATCNPETAGTSPMQEIIHPLVELSLRTLRLNPTEQLLPLRVHIVQTLIGVVDTTGCYIPLGPFIFEFFDTNILRQRTTEEDDLPPFVMKLHLKTPKEYSQTKTYQDALFQAFYDCTVNFYGCLGLSIAFPELAIPVLSKLKENQKLFKNSRFAKPIRTLIEKFETHKNYIEQKRSPIEYSAKKLDEAYAFLRDTAFESTPFGKLVYMH